MPVSTRKLVPSLADLAIKIDHLHESSPAPSDASSTTSFAVGKRKCPSQVSSEMDKDKRRKLMNRVAAQQSRDRKREHVEALELEMKKLRAENVALKRENERIQREKDQLALENEKIKIQTELKQEDNVVQESSTPMTFESAAFISGPLQQGQVTRAYLLQTFVCLLLQFLQLKDSQIQEQQQVPSLTTSLPSSKNSAKNWSKEDLQQTRQLIMRYAPRIPLEKNWDPPQTAWNPSRSSFNCHPISLSPLS